MVLLYLRLNLSYLTIILDINQLKEIKWQQ